jgi:hypothetical protein
MRVVIKPEIKEALLKSQKLMGAVADDLSTNITTVQRQLKSDSPMLTTVASMDAIKKALAMPEDSIIHQYEPIGDKDLQHE